MVSPAIERLSLNIICLLLVLEQAACLRQNPSKASVRQKLPQQQQQLYRNKHEVRHDTLSLIQEKPLRGGRGTDGVLDEGRGESAEEGWEGRGNGLGSSGTGEGVGLAGEPSNRVLILDVDSTLYDRSAGVEQQVVNEQRLPVQAIVEGLHRFFEEELGLSRAECDDLHRLYGSTVWGLQREGRISTEQVERYYREVFDSVSLTGLHEAPDGSVPSIPPPLPSSSDDYEGGDSTGFQHRASASAMIRAHRGPVFVASNSPLQHVRRVLEELSLTDVPFAGVLTPDTRGWLTKSCPEFYYPILVHDDVERLGRGELWLLDDSPANLEVASSLGLQTLRVDGDGKGMRAKRENAGLSLDRAVACFVGAIPHPDDWQFSEPEYLRSKNVVDRESRSQDVWRRLVKEVAALDLGPERVLRVADLGCGLLPLLEEFRYLAKACGVRRLEYCGLEKETGVATEACQDLLRKGYTLIGGGDVKDSVVSCPKAGQGAQTAWHLRMVIGDDDPSSDAAPPDTAVLVTTKDFVSVDLSRLFPSPNSREEKTSDTWKPRRDEPLFHVMVGCCLADLLPPGMLLHALKRLVGSGGGATRECLVYLPITFVGKTDASPAAPQEGCIPSDASVLAAYDACLREEQGHHTCIDELLDTIQDQGGDMIALSPSSWYVSRDAHPYMWQCLLYFIGLGVAPRPPPLLEARDAAGVDGGVNVEGGTAVLRTATDLAGWVRRMRERAPNLTAHNMDLLFRLRAGSREDETATAIDNALHNGTPLPAGRSTGRKKSTSRSALSRVIEDVSLGGGASGESPGGDKSADFPPPSRRENTFLEFVAPGKVEVRCEDVPGEEAVGEGQVLVEAVCSSISSGTELKVFRGDFDANSELDATIKGMAGETMSYPLRYGYSMVGRVAKCGQGVDASKFLGKLVFTFSPHSSWVVADAGGIMLVPEGIAAEDAVYVPAVETALSLVHDVHPRVGESVAVFGQGMIGLLAVSILAKTHGTVGGGLVVAVDVLQNRLEVAKRLGASAVVTPSEAVGLAPFDVSLEVTGNPRGLQSALDLTGYGGRVILGSWYGGGELKLNLGMTFHRSHLTIQASQVSRLPAGLTDRWDKDRRFAAAWSLVRELRPSRFLTTRSTGLMGAQEAYESLGAGSELGVVFRYK